MCGVLPVPVQVHVTVEPTATVSRARFMVPLWPLWKKMLPTVTVPGAPPMNDGVGLGDSPGHAT